MYSLKHANNILQLIKGFNYCNGWCTSWGFIYANLIKLCRCYTIMSVITMCRLLQWAFPLLKQLMESTGPHLLHKALIETKVSSTILSYLNASIMGEPVSMGCGVFFVLFRRTKLHFHTIPAGIVLLLLSFNSVDAIINFIRTGTKQASLITCIHKKGKCSFTISRILRSDRSPPFYSNLFINQ